MAEPAAHSRVGIAMERAGDTLRPLADRLRNLTWFWIAGSVLLAVALPLFLITGSVRIVSTSELLYDYGFDKYDIERRTGIPRAELDRAAESLIDYFGNGDVRIDSRVNFGQGDVPLYKEREILHLVDVKSLFRLVNDVEKGSFGFVAFFILLALAVRGWSYLPLLWRTLLWSGAGTLVLVIVIGIATAISFDEVFLRFHLVSFANDLWLLDPRTHYLIQMFPQNFFLDATLAISAFVIVEFGAILGAVWLFNRKARKRLASGAG